MNDILIGNNNNAIIKKLAGRSFEKNKIRNIAAILAIIMTAFLFTSITSLGFGVVESLQLTQQMQKGSKADGDIRYMTAEQFDALRNSDIVEQAGCRQVVGFMSNTVQHIVEINYADKIQQELTFCTPTHGRAPQSLNEVATTDLALKDLGIEPQLGVLIPVEFELRGETHHVDMVLSGWWEAANAQLSIMVVSQAFMEEHRGLFPNTYARDREMAGTYLSDVVLKDKTDVQDQLQDFARSVAGDPDDMYADNYILCAANKFANTPVQSSTLIALVSFLLLFLICGYLLIYNIFDISVMRDTRQYGLLRTIGTSTRQIKRIVNRQAVWMTILGLPLGLIAGFFVGKACLPIIISIFSYNSQTATQMSPSPFIFIISAIFTVLTVFISIRKPVKKASKISPLEAIRFTGQENLKKRKSKRTKGATLSQMAFINMGRNKRRTAFIILSMLLCIVLFNSILTITQSLDMDKWVSRNTKTDFTVYNANISNRFNGFSSHDDGLDVSVAASIAQQQGVIDSRYLYKNTVDDRNVTVDYGYSRLGLIAQEERDGRTFDAYDNGCTLAVSEDNGLPYGNVCGVSDAFLRNLTIYDGETNTDTLMEKMATGQYIILGSFMNKLTGHPINLPFEEQLDVGETISVYKNGEIVKTYTILAKATLVMTEIETLSGAIGANRVGGDAPFIYVTEQDFMEIYDKPTLLSYGFNVQEEYYAQITEFLNNYIYSANTSTAFISTELMHAQLQSIRIMIMLIGGIIGLILALAGLINFTNMMITNIISRRHEFAAMQSIGMTRRQLRRMTIWEGVYYAVGAGVFGTLLVIFLGQTVLRNVLNSSSMWYFTFHFTLLPALIIFMIYLIIAAIIPMITLHFFNKGSVVERLQKTD